MGVSNLSRVIRQIFMEVPKIAYKSTLLIGHKETHQSSNFALCQPMVLEYFRHMTEGKLLRRLFEYPFRER